MFLENKYFKWYNQIIDSSKLSEHDYYEKHHIIPKSMGGPNCLTNLAKLSARQHYICHWLLTKCVKKHHMFKMISAFHRMNINPLSKTRINGKAFEVNRKNFSKAMSEFQKHYTKTPEHLEKIAMTKRGKPLSDNNRKNLSVAKTGTKLSVEHKAKIAKGLLGKIRGSYEKITCPHCNLLIDGGNFKRWHGDNCKLKLKLI